VGGGGRITILFHISVTHKLRDHEPGGRIEDVVQRGEVGGRVHLLPGNVDEGKKEMLRRRSRLRDEARGAREESEKNGHLNEKGGPESKTSISNSEKEKRGR